MTSASTVAGDPQSKSARLGAINSAFSRRPLLPALLVVALATALRLSGTVDSDVSWQLWIAHQINGGAHLYRDIVEINPPLWFWMALPVDRISALTHARSDHVLILIIGCAVALSVSAVDRLLPSIGRPRRGLLLVYTALILTVMPWMQAGQREQLVLMGAVPYAMLIASRRTGRPVPPALAFAVGTASALGFALKHYFLIVPVLLELWLLSGQRKAWRPIRPETMAIVAVGIAYGLAVLLFATDFFDSILPLVRLAYAVTGAPRVIDLLQPAVIVGLVTLTLIAMQWTRMKSDISAVPAALLVASGGFLIVYFAQSKGWAYHALPLLGCSSLALAALFAGTKTPPPLIKVFVPALLLAPFLIAAKGALGETAPSPDLRGAVAGLRPGDSVGFIATDPALAWSITYQQGLGYPSRYMGFWMMRAVVRNEELGGPDARLTELGRRVVRETIADFRCQPPRRIIVARPKPGSSDSFDILLFFRRDPNFAALLGHYRPIGRTSVEIYEMISPLEPAPAARCIFRAR